LKSEEFKLEKIEFGELSHQEQSVHITEMAREVLTAYPFQVESLEVINFEFNATFRVVTTIQETFALRVNVNSERTFAHLQAEIALVSFLNQAKVVNLPHPIPTKSGKFAQTIFSPLMKKDLGVVLYSWLDGEVLGDEPSEDSLKELGAAMAQMHQAVQSFVLPSGCELPVLRDFMWGTTDVIFTADSVIGNDDRNILTEVRRAIEEIIENLYGKESAIVIHADLHGWNVMSHDDEIFIFDFDDSGIGLRVQDLATTLYYLDTPEQDAALLAGYQSVMDLPVYNQYQMKGLLLQRRIILLNYLFDTTNVEHREMAPNYLVETLRRAKEFLEQR
jgi:Ser/Thr protein kinase RdoA (MazF antagonist)